MPNRWPCCEFVLNHNFKIISRGTVLHISCTLTRHGLYLQCVRLWFARQIDGSRRKGKEREKIGSDRSSFEVCLPIQKTQSAKVLHQGLEAMCVKAAYHSLKGKVSSLGTVRMLLLIQRSLYRIHLYKCHLVYPLQRCLQVRREVRYSFPGF